MSDHLKPADQIHEESKVEHSEKEDSPEILTSAFADCTKKEILRQFWRLYAVGLAVSLGGMYAGYCGSATGNIVANPGKSDRRVIADRTEKIS